MYRFCFRRPFIHGQTYLIPDFDVFNVTILPTVYRFTLKLSPKTFKNENLNNLNLEWLNQNNEIVNPTSWLQLNKNLISLIGYISDDLYDNYPVNTGYKFVLKATETTSKKKGIKTFFFKLSQKPIPPFYYQILTMSSKLSSLYAKNNVEILFAIQEQKFFLYNKNNQQGIPSLDYFITHSLQILKFSNGSTKIILKWSSPIFYGGQCPVQPIVKYRKQIVNENAEKFKSMFQPEYVIKSIKEKLQGRCVYYSLLPARVGLSWKSLSISFGYPFSTDIPPALFLPPENSNMTLKLELRSNGVNIGTSKWIYLYNGVIKAYPLYDAIANQQTFSFHLVAITPFLSETSNAIEIKVTGFKTIEMTWEITFHFNSKVTMALANFLTLFIKQICDLLSVQVNMLILINYEVVTSRSSYVKWTLTKAVTCNHLNNYNSILLSPDGKPTQRVNESMKNIGVTLSSITIIKNVKCQGIQVKQSLGSRIFVYTTFYQIFIHPTAYSSSSGNSNLHYSISYISDNSFFSLANWLTVKSSTRTIYGIPIATQLQKAQTYTFKLKVTDSLGNSVTDTLTLIVNKDITTDFPKRTLFSITFRYSVSYTTLAEAIYQFVHKLVRYFGDSNRNLLIIYDVNLLDTEKRITLKYYNTSFKIDHCDINSYDNAKSKLLTNEKPNPLFVNIFQPNFIIEVVTITSTNCQRIAVKIQLGTRIFRYSTFYETIIQQNAYSGNGNLEYEILLNGDDPFSPKNWLTVNSETKIIYGVPIANRLLKGVTYSFHLKVKDDLGHVITDTLKLNVTEDIISYLPKRTIFTISFKYLINYHTLPEVLYRFFEKLVIYFGDVNRNLLVLYDVKTFLINEVVTVKYYNTSFNINKCDKTAYDATYSKLFYEDKPNFRMVSSFQPNFIIQSILISNSNCQRIEINAPIGTRLFSYTTFYRIIIESNAYSSSESLRYSIAYNRKDLFSAASWLTLNSNTRTIYGIPIANQLLKGQTYTFTLKITNAIGYSVYDNLNIVVTENIVTHIGKRYLYIISIQYSTIYSSLAETLYVFIDLLVKYFGDANQDNLVIYEVVPYPDSRTMTVKYYNNSFKVATCDRNAHQIAVNLLQSNGTPSAKLLNYVKPTFVIQSITSYNSYCQGVIINKPLGIIIFKYSTFYKIEIPPNAYSATSGTLKFSIAHHPNSSPFSPKNWLTINSNGGNVYGVPVTHQLKIGGTYLFSLKVSNNIDASVTDTFQLVVRDDFTTLLGKRHLYIIQFEYQSIYKSIAETLYSFFDTLVTYFGDSDRNLLVISHVMSYPDSKRIDVKYFNSSHDRDTCDIESHKNLIKHLIQRGSPKPSLVSYFLPSIKIQSVSSENNLCKGITLKKPLGTLEFRYMTFYRILIHKDAFLTSSEKLQMKIDYGDSSPFSSQNWLVVDSNTRVIKGVPITNNLKVGQSYYFNLKIENDHGISIIDTFKLIVIGDNFPIIGKRYLYSITFQYSSIYSSFAQILYAFIGKLVSYFGDANSNLLAIQDVTIYQNNKIMIVKYFNQSFNMNSCDRIAHHAVNKLLITQEKPNANLINYFIPAFSIQSVTYKNPQCQDIRINKPLGSIIFHYKTFYQFTISWNAYTSPSAELNYKVLFHNNNAFSTTNWLEIKRNTQILQGIPIATELSKAESYTVTIQVANSIGMSITDTLKLIIQDNSIPKLGKRYLYVISFRYTFIYNSFAHILYAFIEKLVNYFGDDSRNSLVVHEVLPYFNQREMTVKYFNISYNKDICDRKAHADVEYFLLSGSSPKQRLIKHFRPSFQILSVQSENSNCQGIKIKKPLGTTIFQYRTFYEIFIHQNSYISEGSTLKYHVVVDANSFFSPMNWLTVNSNTRAMQGVPVADQLTKGSNYYFTLKITNTFGDSITDTLELTVKDDIITGLENRYLYKITFQYNAIYISLAEIMYDFFNMLVNYFGDINRNLLVIYRVNSFRNNNRVVVTYYNTSFILDPCDLASHTEVNSKLFYGEKPHPNIVNYFQPNFMIHNISSSRGKCRRNLPPFVNIELLSNSSVAGPFQIQWGYYLINQIHENLFQDEEDRVRTRGLELKLKKYGSNTSLRLDSWIYFNQFTQTIFIVPTDMTISELGKRSYIMYQLTATDSGDKNGNNRQSVHLQLSIEPIGVISNYYNVTFYMDVYDITRFSYSEQLVHILPTVEKLLGIKYRNQICVRKYKVLSQSGYSIKAKLIWTPCQMSHGVCNFEIINELRKLFYKNDQKRLNSNIARRLRYIQITGILDDGYSKCGFTPPKVTKPIPPLSISFCGLFSYNIPENTFFDNEEGNTRNLKINLRRVNNLPLESWITFDSQYQTIYALLSKHHYAANFPTTYTYIIEAIDGTLLTTSHAITLYVKDKPQKTDYSITLVAQPSFNLKIDSSFMILAKKIGNYYGDNGKGFEAINQAVTANGFDIYEFGNCSIRYSPCDPYQMKLYKRLIKDEKEKWKMSFTNIFAPEFQHITLTDHMTGPCVDDEPPVLLTRFGPLYVSTNATYSAWIPENTFRDKENGYTRNLKLELTRSDGAYLQPTFWIYFNATSQQILIVASKNLALSLSPISKLSLKLTAYDDKTQSASQILEIFVAYPVRRQSHYFRMTVTVLDKNLRNTNVVNVLNHLRISIKKYFQDNDDNVMFSSFTSSFTSAFMVEWSNSSISNIVCEDKKISFVKNKILNYNAINYFFTMALAEFRLLEVKFHFDGVCIDPVLTLEVLGTIPPIKATFCESLIYQIPENIFYDKDDGNTRNLVLTLTQNGFDLPKNSFISFDSALQKIILAPYNTYFKGEIFPKRKVLTLTARNKIGLSVSTSVIVDIERQPPKYSYYVQISAAWDTRFPQKELTFSKISDAIQMKISKYLDYMTRKNINVIALTRPKTLSYIFNMKFTSCALTYDPCDTEKISSLEKKLLNLERRSYNPKLASFLLPEIQIYSIATIKIGPCKSRKQSPTQYLPIPDIYLDICSSYRYRLNPQTFLDDEDGYDLRYVITEINNLPMSVKSTWIYSKPNKYILATVNNDVLIKQGHGHYTITYRAFDKNNLFVDAKSKIFIRGKQAQTNYFFILSLKPKSYIEEQAIEKYHISMYINSFFKNNVTNFVSMHIIKNSDIKFTWSSCSLPRHCDLNSAKIFLMNMKIDYQIVEKFEEVFKERYILTDVQMTVNENCIDPPSPPKPSVKMYLMKVNQCGGLTKTIPETLFYDKEDGNTRGLKLQMKQIDYLVLPQWIFFHQDNQTIYVNPTRTESLLHNNNPVDFKLIATDKSDLSASITIKIVIEIPPEPKYTFSFKYTVLQNFNNRVLETLMFSKKVARYTESRITSAGLIEYNIDNANTKEFTYGDCLISYNPCDDISIERLKRFFIDFSTNLPNNFLKMSMLPQFQIVFVKTKAEYPCNQGIPIPPKIIKEIKTISISKCGYFSYKIPENTFYDNQDGNTRNLNLSLFTIKNNPLKKSSWLQFNSQQQVIYAVALHKISEENPNGINYILTATDTTDLATPMTFTVFVGGSSNNLNTECKIEIVFNTNDRESNFVQRLQYLLSKLRNYFQLESLRDIFVVDFKKHVQTQFILTWSYCPLVHEEESSSGHKKHHFNLISKILMKLFLSDREKVNPSFYDAFGTKYSVQNVRTLFTGRCRNLPPVVPPQTPVISITVSECGYTQRYLENSLFYDFEQGGTSNLLLQLYEKMSNKEIFIDSFISLDIDSRSIIAISTAAQKYLTNKVYTFTLKAVDDIGQYAELPVYVQIRLSPLSKVAPFEITFFLEYTGSLSKSMGFQAKYIIQQIKSFYQIPTNKLIFIHSYKVIPGLSEARKMVWTTCFYQSCQSLILQRSKELMINKNLRNEINNYFMPEFKFHRLYHKSSLCDLPIIPPDVITPVPPLKPEFCSELQFILDKKTFYDETNGYTRELEIKLLDNEDQDLRAASWIQFDEVNLKIYAIKIENLIKMQHKTTFKLVAFNSASLARSLPLRINTKNGKHITDCVVSVNFKYKYLQRDTVNLDVLWKFVTRLNSYYNDAVTKIKVINFLRDENFIFHLMWTNCSFKLNTKAEANNGLNEIKRIKLTEIYSKLIITGKKIINKRFKKHFSKFFEILLVDVSYTCIENPPYPKKNETIELYAGICQVFKYSFERTMFLDEKDVDITNMKIELTYLNKTVITEDNWLQINSENKHKKFLYGIVTESVIKNCHLNGYQYLIMCTDSSGRKAWLRLSVIITDFEFRNFNNDFIVGFVNNISPLKSDAFALLTLAEKIAQFFGQMSLKNNIFIKEFERYSHVKFSLCTSLCNNQYWNDIFYKFQLNKYDTTPSMTLVSVMKREFLVNYAFVSSPQCISVKNESIIPSTCGPIENSVCGDFSYRLPKTCFRDNYGLTANSFFVEFLDDSGSRISEVSWIQYKFNGQSFYGIPIFDHILPLQTFILVARHPTSRKSAKNSVTIKFNDYNLTKSFSDSYCRVEITFENNFAKSKTDVTIIQELLRKFSTYINKEGSLSSFFVINFKRNKETVTLMYSNCTWIDMLKSSQYNFSSYKEDVLNYLSNFFQLYESRITDITPRFREYLLPEFNFTKASITSSCTIPTVDPPIANSDVSLALDKGCGPFSYLVPENTFRDKKYGNTRFLSLTIVDVQMNSLNDEMWISIDKEQHIFGIISRSIYQRQPLEGYRFKLKATNKDQLVSYTDLVLQILPWVFVVNETTGKEREFWDLNKNENKIHAVANFEAKDYPSKLLFMYNLIAKINNYTHFKKLLQNLECSFYIESFESDRSISEIRIAPCLECRIEVYQTLKQVKLMTTDFYNFLNETTDIIFVDIKIPPINNFNKGCVELYAVKVYYNRTIDLCSNNVFYLSEDFPGVDQLQVDFQTETGSPVPNSSLINFFENPYRVVSFPNSKLKSSQPSLGTVFLITLRVGQEVLGKPFCYRFRVVGESSSNALQYDIELKSFTPLTEPDVYYISIIWNITQEYLQIYEMEHIMFAKSLYGEKYFLSWYFCKAPKDCSNALAKNISNLLLAPNNNINPSFIQKIPSNLELTKLNNKCNNTTPTVNPDYYIEIQQCGCTRHSLPNTLAYDPVDGYLDKLKISLKNADGTNLNPNSWIEVNNTEKQIIALPTTDIIQSAGNGELQYLLYITNSAGKSTKTNLFITFVNYTKGYYFMSFDFGINNKLPSSYLKIMKKFLTYLAEYVGHNTLGHYHITKAYVRRSSQRYEIEVQNCSIQNYICLEENNILKSTEKLIGNAETGQINPQFLSFMQELSNGEITLLSFTTKSLFQTNLPPALQSEIPGFILNHCSRAEYNIPTNLFRDNDNLDYTLKNDFDKDLIVYNFLTLFNETIYMVPFINVNQGLYQYDLIATDTCQQENSAKVNINISDNQAQSNFSIKLKFDGKINSLSKNYILSKIQEDLKRCFYNISDMHHGIKSENLIEQDDSFTYQVSDCAPCDIESIEKVTSFIYTRPNVVSQRFKDCFSNHKLENVYIIRRGDCFMPNPPKVNEIPVFEIYFCQNFAIQIPEDLFHDNEDGGTRNLKLHLYKGFLNTIPHDSDIQFNNKTQTVYGYLRSSLSPKTLPTDTIYKLKATDSSGSSALVDVIFKIAGEIPVINYVFDMHIEPPVNKNEPFIDRKIEVFKKIKQYFNKAVNNIDFLHNSLEYRILWNFCQESKSKCDCKKVKTALDKLKSQEFNNSLSGLVIIREIEVVFYNVCNSNGKPMVLNDVVNHFLSVGEFGEYRIPDDMFFDTEERYTKNLTIEITDENFGKIPKDYWLVYDQNIQTICFLLTRRDFESWRRNERNEQEAFDQFTFSYQIIAKDSCDAIGSTRKQSRIRQFVNQYRLKFLIWIILFGNFGELKKNCTKTKTLTEKIADYSGVPKSEIFFDEFRDYNNSRNYTQIYWGYKSYSFMTCENKSFEEMQKKFFVNEYKEPNTSFIEYMNPEFMVRQVRNSTITCPPNPVRNGEFPWWIIWIFVAFLILAILIWLIWLCFPRCCPKACVMKWCGWCCCDCCRKCCTTQGCCSPVNPTDTPLKHSDRKDAGIEQGIFFTSFLLYYFFQI